jgi:mevalonate kinase
MKIRLSAPSKTFLLGEYLVLKGGKALVLGTKPRFSLLADSKGRGHVEGIHPSSPAGRFIENNQQIFRNWDIGFSDPHEGLGGFGASSAQFLFAYALSELAGETLTQNKIAQVGQTMSELSLPNLWQAFREYAGHAEGIMPSGADVIGQALGSLAAIDIQPPSESGKLPAISGFEQKWSFEQHGFFLVRTGRKVATHQHLRELKDIDVDELKSAFAVGEQAVQTADGELLAASVTLYQNALYKLGLVAHESSELIEALSSTEAVAAVKGCGALGADVLFVLFEKPNEAIVRDRLNLLGLSIVASEKDLSEGIKLVIDRTRVRMKGVSV